MSFQSEATTDTLSRIADLVDALLVEPWEPQRVTSRRREAWAQLAPLILGDMTLSKHDTPAFDRLMNLNMPLLRHSRDRVWIAALFVVGGALARSDPAEFKRFLSNLPVLNEMAGLNRIIDYLVRLYVGSTPFRPELRRQLINLIFEPVEDMARAGDLRQVVDFVASRLADIDGFQPDIACISLDLMGAVLAARRGVYDLRHQIR
ncbi:hypothetical protein [Asticcacaulis sp. AND118]|uniref:hypothetical protein n=1 Tax=Asticcacaulis sp. AND118 TaxID=2840468 RepID=UPI001D000E97|nr:hypothetical protein [Asticcacaulis sp. AND118]UDF05468.1 hypothetical protein LH365_14810 [Asticcacaulis sp. AND118]